MWLLNRGLGWSRNRIEKEQLHNPGRSLQNAHEVLAFCNETLAGGKRVEKLQGTSTTWSLWTELNMSLIL